MKIRILEVSIGALIMLVVLSVLFWHSLLPVNVPLSTTQENVLSSTPLKIPKIDLGSIITVIKNVLLITDESISVPTHPLGVEESIGVPVRIRIPSIVLDAAIEKVGLTSDGLMGVPKHSLNAGWYDLGPRPGEIGSAAIDGHVDWINGQTAVFADLHKVKPGDKIEVQDDKGAIISFVVRRSMMYEARQNAVDVFISNDKKSHLNIITCAGAWDKSTNEYSKRLVIFTDLAN